MWRRRSGNVTRRENAASSSVRERGSNSKGDGDGEGAAIVKKKEEAAASQLVVSPRRPNAAGFVRIGDERVCVPMLV